MSFNITLNLSDLSYFDIGHFPPEIRRELLVATESINELKVLISIIEQPRNNITEVGFVGISLQRNQVKSFIYTSHEFLQSLHHFKYISPDIVKKDIQLLIIDVERTFPGIVRARDSVAHANERRAGRDRKKEVKGSLYHGNQNGTFIEFQDSRGRFGLDVSIGTVEKLQKFAYQLVSIANEKKDIFYKR